MNSFRNDVFDIVILKINIVSNVQEKFKDEVYVNLISFCFFPHQLLMIFESYITRIAVPLF